MPLWDKQMFHPHDVKKCIESLSLFTYLNLSVHEVSLFDFLFWAGFLETFFLKVNKPSSITHVIA